MLEQADWIFLSVAVGMASFGCLALPGLIQAQSGFWPERERDEMPDVGYANGPHSNPVGRTWYVRGSLPNLWTSL